MMSLNHRGLVMRALGYIAGMAVVAGTAFLAVYLYFFGVSVTMVNSSGENLSNVKIVLAGEPWWQGDLAARKSKRMFGTVDGNGSILISYEIGDRTVVGGCGYYVDGIGTSDTFDLRSDGAYYVSESETEPYFRCGH